jgi:hypothetical protein
MATKLTEETLAAVKAAQSSPLAKDALTSTQTSGVDGGGQPHPAGYMQSLGLTYYDLEAPAKQIYPVLTPLRNMIPRVKGAGGEATRWKAITGININKEQMGISEGQRSRRVATEVKEYIATYKGLGLEDSISFESTYADSGFDDVRARATEGLLRSVMIGEEQVLLGGNTSLSLGTTPTPTGTDTTTGGSLNAANALKVYCVALTQDGYYRASVGSGVVGAVSRANADSTTDTYGGGAAAVSVLLSLSLTGAATASTATVTVDTVRGAAAYAWYWWQTGHGGTKAKLGAITTVNRVTIKAEATGTQLHDDASLAADNSTNSLVYDGILTQIATSANNSYYKALSAGGQLSASGEGGIAEIETALRHFWDSYKLSPDRIIVSAEQLNDFTTLLVGATGGTLFRFNLDGTAGVEGRTVSAGSVVGQYLNKYSMTGASMIPITIHPYLAPGTILFLSSTLPYPTTNIGQVLQIKTRREYTQIEWPLRTRTYEFGIYLDAVLQHYAPFSMGVITNITKQ